MWEKGTPFQGQCHSYGTKLHAVWDVEADESYDISWPQQKEDVVHPGSIAMCYTLSGQGRLELKNGKCFTMSSNTIFFVPCDQVERYACSAESWRFHWIEFSSFGMIPLPSATCIGLPHYEVYSDSFYDLTYAIRQNTPSYRNLAAAIFSKLIYEWGAVCEDREVGSPHLAKIQTVIGEMHTRIAENWPISEMARMVNMSEPAFRQAFRSITGQSPKKFYSEIRLAMVESLLRKNTLSIAEIADQLGYTDPFHLSKKFKMHYGFPPSELKRKTVPPDLQP